MKNNLIIIGASGHGKVAAEVAKNMNKWSNIYFLDDDKSKESISNYKIIGNVSMAYQYSNNSDYFVAIGDNTIREKITKDLLSQNLSVVSLISPASTIASDTSVGIGTIVMAGAVINSGTRIGRGCIVNTLSSIDHDCLIEDYVHISPGVNLAGSVKLGYKTWIGIGASVINNISITNNCTIGAGSLVIKDIIDSGVYVGSPVRRVSK